MDISAGEFKAKCLKLMDEVQKKRTEVIITKFGKPVAKLVPIKESKSHRKSIVGAMEGTVKINGDIVGPTGVEWEANK